MVGSTDAKGCPLAAPMTQFSGHALFQHLHDPRGIAGRWFSHEHMEMLGHDHQPDEQELVLRAHFVEDFQENVASPRGAQQRHAAVTTAGDEVQVLVAIASFQTILHRANRCRGLPIKYRERKTVELESTPAPFANGAKGCGTPVQFRRKSQRPKTQQPMNYGVINGGGIIGAGEPSIVESTDAKGWPTRRFVTEMMRGLIRHDCARNGLPCETAKAQSFGTSPCRILSVDDDFNALEGGR